MIIDPADTQVYYSLTDAAASYTPLSEATGLAFESSSDNEQTVNLLGGGKHVFQGDDSDDYDFSALFDPTAQQVFIDAKRNKTAIFIILLYDLTPLSEKGYKQSCKVTSYRWESNGDDNAATFSTTLKGEGALTAVTALP